MIRRYPSLQCRQHWVALRCRWCWNAPALTLTASATDLATGLPDPSSYFWTPATGLISAASASNNPLFVNPAVTTTYTVVATDSFGCQDSAQITVEPINNPCVCNIIANGLPVGAFGPSFGAPFGIVSTSYPAGTYYMGNDVQIVGSVTLTNLVIYIGSGFTMYVTHRSSLTLVNCHLLACPPDMWKGIVLQNTGPGTQATIELDNNTLIEDAMIAIDVVSLVTPTGYTPAAGSPLIINSTSAVLNKNNIGIHIEGYNDNITPLLTPVVIGGYPTISYPTPPTSCYPFFIANTVVTSRDFSGYSPTSTVSFSTSYPFNWPSPANLKAPYVPAAYMPPFNIDNPVSACPVGGYPFSLCNTPGVIADKGIWLKDVGLYTTDFEGVVTGAVPTAPANTELDMYDNLDYGIYAENSDVVVRNSDFQHMNGTLNPTYGGDGIYCTNTNSITPGNEYKLWVYGADGSLTFGKGDAVAT